MPFTTSAIVLPDWPLVAVAFCCATAQLLASLPRAFFILFSTLLAMGAAQLAALAVAEAAAVGLTSSAIANASGIAVIKSFFIKFRMFVTSLLHIVIILSLFATHKYSLSFHPINHTATPFSTKAFLVRRYIQKMDILSCFTHLNRL